MESIAQTRGIQIAPEFRNFFAAASSGKFGEASKLYEVFKLRSYQWDSDVAFDPNIGNEIWELVHETEGAYREFTRWDPELLQRYAGDILKSIPDGSIFFGGTDPGRFVISAFRDARDTPKIFVITQNNLANICYLDYLEDLYQNEIWTPARTNAAEAFRRYAEEVEAGVHGPGRRLKVVDDRVIIDGPQGVMEINGILSEMIFLRNKDRHQFYVDEAYVLRWMYPYLEPHGLTMKLNPSETELTDEIIQEDMDFWTDYTERLIDNEDFIKNRPARRTFAQLRCAIGGLYANRDRLQEAEKAFQQALTLCPASPEANMRLVLEVYVKQQRFADARELLKSYQNGGADYYNMTSKVVLLLEHIDAMEKTD